MLKNLTHKAVVPSILVCYLFIFSYQIDNDQYSEIMKQYFLVCGADYFCFDTERINIWNVRPTHSYRHFGLCPDCSCDKHCVLRGDCCPDLFFTFPEIECVNRTIIHGSNDRARDQRHFEHMVAKCPEITEPELRSNCENKSDIELRLQHLPVTGGNFSLTYFNKYCAECHGVNDFLSWSLDVKCDRFTDFNYLSNIDYIIKTAVDGDCTFQSYPSTGENTIIPNCYKINEDETLISKCNQTGNWKLYDANTNKACESSFFGPYRLFKNVFCYICNPTDDQIREDDLISWCNTTGQWQNYDEELEKACFLLPRHPAVRPFKNIFCYICNRGNISSQQFIDINATIDEYITEDSYFRYQYDIHVHSFSYEYLAYFLETMFADLRNINEEEYHPFSRSAFSLQNGTMIDFQTLISQAMALDERQVGTCPNRTSLLPVGFESRCICDPKCIFEDVYECCIDLALELPTTCIDELALSNILIDSRPKRKGYLFINGCFQERKNVLLKDLCLRPRLDDVFSRFPVTDKEKGVAYINLYCFLCNLDSAEYISILNGFSSKNNHQEGYSNILSILKRAEARMKHNVIWNFQITCSTYLDYSHYVKLGDLLHEAWKQRCRILYKSSTGPSVSCDQQNNFADCQSFQNWTFTDQETEWACKNVKNFPKFSPHIYLIDEFPNINISWINKTFRRTESGSKIVQYTNLFCALCSPTNNFSVEPVDVCNVTGIAYPFNYFDSMDTKCLQAQFIYYYYPFKNYFCVNCNGIPVFGSFALTFPSELRMYKRADSIKPLQIVRDMFSLSHAAYIRDTVNNSYCDFLNLMECKNITCFTGKILEGNNCKPLLKVTENLYYHLEISIVASPERSSIMKDLMSAASTSIKQFLAKYFQEEGVLIPKLVGSVDMPCNSTLGENDVLHMDLYIELFFPNSVRRMELEKKLVNIHQEDLNNTASLSSIEFVADRESADSTASIGCSIDASSSYNSASFTGKYFMAKVSNVLLCPQVELVMEEYNISEDGSSLIITKNMIEVEETQFGMTPYGHIRVCYEYLVDKGLSPLVETEEQQDSIPNVRLVSLICTAISVISLLPLFFKYFLFPILRNDSGKMIMLILFNILLNLIFHVFRYYADFIENLCIINGVFLHFIWLSVFTSSTMCMVHHYRRFLSEKYERNKAETLQARTKVFYIFIVFGIPLVVVAVNIGISMMNSKGSYMGYGGRTCFVDKTMSFIFAFICPISLIWLIFILFYLSTQRIINNKNLKGKFQDLNGLTILTWIAMITGISWIFQIIDYFNNGPGLSYVAVSVHALQGLFITIAFVIVTRKDISDREMLYNVNNKAINESQLRHSRTLNIAEEISSQSIQDTKL